MKGLIHITVVAVLLLLSSALAAEPRRYYDEMFLPDGSIRPQYADAYLQYLKLDPKERERLTLESVKDFQGDNGLALVPRILTESEIDKVQRGVAQRGEALRRFMIDLYSGKREFAKAIPGLEAELDKYFERSGERKFLDKMTPEMLKRVRFLYGPDIARGPDGHYYAFEDNPQFLGLLADPPAAQESYKRLMPEAAKLLPSLNSPTQFYDDLVGRMKQLASPQRAGETEAPVLVHLSMPPYAEKEHERLEKLLSQRGVISVTPESINPRLVVKEDGVYLQQLMPDKSTKVRRVGFMHIAGETNHFDVESPGGQEQALVRSARGVLDAIDRMNGFARWVNGHYAKVLRSYLVRGPDGYDLRSIWRLLRQAPVITNYHELSHPDLTRSRVPGLMDAIMSGKVETDFMPGAQFIGDKSFYRFVPDIVRFYMKEEPIILNIHTRVVGESISIERLKASKDVWVLKPADGRGGFGVVVGPKTSQKDWERALSKLQDRPGEYVVQRYMHPSVLAGGIVDMRLVTFHDETGKPVIAGLPGGRYLPL